MSDTTLARPFGVALGVHLGAGTTIALVSWLSLGAIPQPPELRLTFHTPIPVVFDGGEKPSSRPKETPRPAPARKELQQPVAPPDALRPEPPSPPPDSFVEGDPTFEGVGERAGDGSGTGLEGPGAGDGPPGTDPPSPDDGPIDVTGTMTPPRLILKVTPEYPRIPLRAGMSGTVVLRAVIGPDGSVEEARLVSATSPLFVDAARSAVLKWRYTPALQSGMPVRVYFDAVVEFRIR